MEGLPSAGAVAGAKPDSYYANERPDLVAALPRPLGRVLDVGCGAGGLAPGLRAAGADEIVGIELDPGAAARAREVLDAVVEAPVEDAFAALEPPFDTVLCLDVLEHLVDPGRVLTELRSQATPGGHLQVSVPNARHFSLARDLVLRGTFGYEDWGHRDNTHLRWFTRRDLAALLESAGWQVTATWWPGLRRSRWLNRLTRGLFAEFMIAQVYGSARNPG
jgi:2-polyprenyl-3-methyl-5-hydroxy-6-metoxy-1,4-benzoquinol methylase